ncbi:hypothetical protein EJB05_12718, partial [Eragrostis curvula]
MVEEASAAVAGVGTMKMTMMVVGVDESEHNYYAQQWALQHFFPPVGQPQQYHLVVVSAVSAVSAVSFATPDAPVVMPLTDADLKKEAQRVIDKAKLLCAHGTPFNADPSFVMLGGWRLASLLQVTDAVFEVLVGDATNVLCEAVERHQADMLVVGSHGYGAIKSSPGHLGRAKWASSQPGPFGTVRARPGPIDTRTGPARSP